jgi:hypothetical protein
MTYDSETFRHRASSLPGDSTDDAEVAGHLALAYAALERRRRAAALAAEGGDDIDDKPILLQE